jgi:predicted DNA-binding transcriptional regulator YafY
LKQYNNRWFLIGQNPNYESFTNLALDRITSISINNDKDYIESDIDFEEYFDDVIGVTIPKNRQVEKIEIYVADQKTKGYIETKPLHGSQTPLNEFDDGYKFSIKLTPNNELESLLLSFGENIKILAPDSLKERVKNRLIESIKHYE